MLQEGKVCLFPWRRRLFLLSLWLVRVTKDLNENESGASPPKGGNALPWDTNESAYAFGQAPMSKRSAIS